MGAGICKWDGEQPMAQTVIERHESNTGMSGRRYHEIPHDLGPKARCPGNHQLKKYEAEEDGYYCETCGEGIAATECFVGCDHCHWYKCHCCHENGLQLKVGQSVQAICDFTSASSPRLPEQKIKKNTRGVVTLGSSGSGDEDSVCIKFSHHFCLTMEAVVHNRDLECLVVLDEPEEEHFWLIAFLTIVGGLFLFGILYHKTLSFQLGRFVHWCRTLGGWAAVLITVIASILPVIMLPVFPIMALSGPLFTRMNGHPLIGGAIAFGCTFTGLWLGSVIAFALGKSFFKDFAKRAGAENKNLSRLNKIVEIGGTKIVFMARALPILPAEVFDYACAVTSLQIYQYAIGCLGSAIPVAFWTFSTAQATAAAHDSKGSAAHHVLLIVINICALAALTVMLIRTIQTAEVDEGGNGTQLAAAVCRTCPTLRRMQTTTFHVTRTVTSWIEPVTRDNT